MTDTLPPPISAMRLTPGTASLFAADTEATTANIYYNQTIVSLIARSFAVSGVADAQVTAATYLGYEAGLVLLVPLGDGRDRRRLILWQVAVLILALLAAALAPSLLTLTVAAVIIGFTSTIAQQIVPIVAELATPEGRGARLAR